LCLWADPAEALRLAQIGFWVHLPFQPVATKIGELELLALDGGGPAVAGVLAARTGGGGEDRWRWRRGGLRQGRDVIWRVWEDGRSLWGAIHGGGSSSKGDRQREAVPVVAGGDLMVVEVRGTRATLLEVLVNWGMARGGLPQRWESGGAKRSWFSPWPDLTRGGRLWRLEGEMLGLSERRRGEQGESEKKVLLTSSTVARIRASRRAHVGSGYRRCTVTTESSFIVSHGRALVTGTGR
jgi:hypothetical protein